MSLMESRIESIDTYMDQIRQYPLASREEEVSLARAMRDGSPEERRTARERLIQANLRLVVKIAHDFRGMGLGFADLVAEGNLGLLTAADRFDPENGAKFSCYAAWWIKQAMRKAALWKSRTIRIPGASSRNLALVSRARTAWIAEHSCEPSRQELSDLTGLSLKTLSMLSRAATETLSLDESLNGDTDTTFEDQLDAGEPEPWEGGGYLRTLLEREMAGLSQLDRLLICGSFGLSGDPVPEDSLSRRTGLSVADIRARIAAALAVLRTRLSACSDALDGRLDAFGA